MNGKAMVNFREREHHHARLWFPGHFAPLPCSAALAVLAAALFGGAVAAADASAPTGIDQASSIETYCGINALYAAMKMAGDNTPFVELVKPEYISSQNGSSLADLKRAAEAHGYEALPVTALDIDALRDSAYPMILHVKKTPLSESFDHYELFVGMENDKVLLYDPPHDLRAEPVKDLLPRWAGTALVLSATPINSGALFWPTRKKLLALLIGASLLLAALRSVRHRYGYPERAEKAEARFGFSVMQAAVLIGAAFICGVLYNFTNDAGLLAHAESQRYLRAVHVDDEMEVIDTAEARELADDGVFFVDARQTRDFDMGHINGAINIPPDAPLDSVEKALTGIDHAQTIVVYCQSAGCPYAEKVARLLVMAGYENLVHYKGGWMEWTAS